MENKPSQLVVYGNSWCYESRRARKILDQYNIPYTFIDIDSDMNGRSFVEKVNNGNRSVPTIVFPDGSIMVEPAVEEFKAKLGIVENPPIIP